jgi:CHC2 zinc finger
MIDDMSGWNTFDPALDIDNPNEVLGQAIPILTLLDRFNIDYTPAGQDQYKTLCLWHDDSNPSLNIYEKTNSYFCWSCRANGGLVEFMARCMGSSGCPGTLGYNRAISELCRMAGITSGESVAQFIAPPKRKPEETIDYWVVRAGNEIRKHLQTKEGNKGYDAWNAWADSHFKRLDCMLDSGKNDQWEKAKKYYDAILKQIRGGK